MHAVDLEPNHFWASYHLAENHLQGREYAAALANLTNCIRLRPEFVWPYLLRGFAYGETKRFRAAESDLDRAKQLHVDDDLARYGLHIYRGVLRIRHGHHLEQEAAQKKLDDADAGVADYLKAVKEFDVAVTIRPNSYQGFANLADALQKLAKAKKGDEAAVLSYQERALKALDIAIRLQPDATLHRTRARLHLVRHDYDAAFPDLEKALKLSLNRNRLPEHVDDAIAEGVISQGEREDIATDLIDRGKILYRRGDYEAALSSFTVAAAVDPLLLISRRLRGETLFKLLRYREAIDDFDTYLERGGKQVAELFEARGLARAKLGKYELAAEDYTRALEAERIANRDRADWVPSPHLLTYRGWAYILVQANSLALRDFDRALQVEPRSSDALTGRGYCRARLGLLYEAIADTRDAVKIGPASSRLLYNAARNYALIASQWFLDPTRKKRQATLQEFYQLQSIDMLCKSIELMAPAARDRFWQDVEVDSALDGIRSTARYKALEKMFRSAQRNSQDRQ